MHFVLFRPHKMILPAHFKYPKEMGVQPNQEFLLTSLE